MRQKITRAIDIAFILAALAAIFGSYQVVHENIKFIRIVSNSMAPTIHKGDTVIVKSIPTTDLKVGQVAVLPSLHEPGVYYAHRVIWKEISANSEVMVKTKGDANPIPDDWKYVITSPEVPIYLGQLPTAQIPFLHISRWLLVTLFGLALLLFGSLFLPSRNRVNK